MPARIPIRPIICQFFDRFSLSDIHFASSLTAIQEAAKNPTPAKKNALQKLFSWGRKTFGRKKTTKNNFTSAPAFDPLPFANEVKRKEHKLYKNLRY